MKPILIRFADGSYIHSGHFMLFVGGLLAILLLAIETKRTGERPEKIWGLMILLSISAVYGAHIFYWLDFRKEYGYGLKHLFIFWKGGMALYGGGDPRLCHVRSLHPLAENGLLGNRGSADPSGRPVRLLREDRMHPVRVLPREGMQDRFPLCHARQASHRADCQGYAGVSDPAGLCCICAAHSGDSMGEMEEEEIRRRDRPDRDADLLRHFIRDRVLPGRPPGPLPDPRNRDFAEPGHQCERLSRSRDPLLLSAAGKQGPAPRDASLVA